MRFWRRRANEVDEEIASHIAMSIADRVAQGASPEEARRAAHREFGNPLLVRETTQRMWPGEWLEHVLQDIRYAWRQMRRSPAFSITVIATLALGVGATLAMFTVVERVLLQVLPYASPQRLVKVQESGRRGDSPNICWLDIQQWRLKARSFESLGFHTPANGRFFLEGDGGAQQIRNQLVSTNLFHVLGVSPALGSGFSGTTDTFANTGEESTVILSDTAWRQFFGARPDIIGRIARINGKSYTVVGVMPRGFALPLSTTTAEVWTPAPFTEASKTHTSETPTYMVVARLRAGASIQSADAEIKAIQPSVAAQYTDMYLRELVSSASVSSYAASLVEPEVRRAVLALFAASALLWIIACINVGGLLFARRVTRQCEIAVRGALGASRIRIVQQLILEGLSLSIGGSLLGLVIAFGLLRLFAHGLSLQLNLHDASPGWKSIAVLLALTVCSALVSALWPALTSARASIEPALRQGARQSGISPSQHRTRSLLVVSQISLALVLLFSCGLLLRTIYALRQVPLGFRTDNILVGSMAIPSYRFVNHDLNATLYAPILKRVRALPGVEAATLMTEVPLGHSFRMMFSFSAEGNSADAIRRRDIRANFRAVNSDAQRVFGFTMLRGRYFNQDDTAGSQAVVVVNHEFVKEFSQSNDPDKIIGQNIMNFGKERRAIVIGVLDDSRQVSVTEQPAPEIQVYFPQLTPDSGTYKVSGGIAMSLALRTSRSTDSIVPELRSIMTQASPEFANTEFSTMTQIVEDSYGSQQLISRLLIVFGGSALLLCLSGLYGLLAQLVTQRTREIGVRVALGASRSQVVWLVLRQAGGMILAGACTGLTLAWFSSRFLSSYLYGVRAHDTVTLIAVALLLAIGGFTAAFLPARRAASVNPVEALRME
ncbi:ABC transporter permease [Terriglobus albidus]|uniref:ABC transporter permease n=1 Tax=Terriglobus albidus TaxID=1592106 RepID=UPI0021DFE6B2|nr:ABC transporter permease [Terriglobus albidus]